MNKLHNLILAYLLLVTAQTFGQGWRWANAIGNINNHTEVNCLANYNNHNLLVGGYYQQQVISLNENHVNKGQNDGFVALKDAQGAFLWSDVIGGAGNEEVRKVVADNPGNIYVGGHFSSLELEVAGKKLVNRGGNDIFLVKYNAVKEPVWALALGDREWEDINEMLVDEEGNVLISWTYLTFNSGEYRFYGHINKINPLGEIVWEIKMESTTSDSYIGPKALAIDEHNNYYCAIEANGEVSFSNGFELPVNHELQKVFILKISASGFPELIGNIDDWVYIRKIICRDGMFYVGGNQEPDSGGFFDIRLTLAKYNEDLTLLWNKKLIQRVGSIGNSHFSDFDIDNLGNAYVIGTSQADSVFFGNTILTNNNGNSFYVYNNVLLLKYNQHGQAVWGGQISGPLNDLGTSILVHGDNTFTVGGSFQSNTIRFGNLSLENNGILVDISNHWMPPYYERSPRGFVASFGNVVSSSVVSEVQSLQLHPNPSQDHFFIRSDAFSKNPVQIQIFTTDGKIINQQNILPLGNSIRVETGDLSSGLYIVNVIADFQISAERFVKH